MEDVAFECKLLRDLQLPLVKMERKKIESKGDDENKVTEGGKHGMYWLEGSEEQKQET